MIRIRVIQYETGESHETTLTPEILNQGGGLIGRNSRCTLVLNSPEVSRVHAKIMYRQGAYYFADLGSTDGSLVNDGEASTNQNFLLNVDDIIRIGCFILLIKEVNLNGENPNYEESNDTVPNQIKAATTDKIQPHKSAIGFNAAPGTQTLPGSSTQLQSGQTDLTRAEQFIIDTDTLKAQGLSENGKSEITFQGRDLVEGLTMAKRLRERALSICQAELDAGRFCLVVEHPSHFTIWQEKV
ncbi:MAG: FHA domain-containing protein [Cyanothece sp. SIO1E1]|nr:FHA domain-containing protein [Cyanothece sp. SIO1E1]